MPPEERRASIQRGCNSPARYRGRFGCCKTATQLMRTEKAGIMNRTISALALLASLAACKQQESMKASPETLSITDAVVRLAPIESRPAAAYFTIHGGKTPDRLTAVSSSNAARIELHESSMQGGMMSMK